MNAASSLFLDRSTSSPTGARVSAPETLIVPSELIALFEESPRAEASFASLDDEERRGFVRYIDGAAIPATRERRAAIIAMSLLGLADERRSAGASWRHESGTLERR